MWLLLPAVLAQDLDLRGAVRVDDPNHPDALVVSETGAVLPGPPATGPWRWEPLAETDATPAFEALQATNVDLWHDRDARGQGVRIAVLDPGFVGAEAGELGAFTTHDCVGHRSCAVAFDPLRTGSGTHGTACAEIVRDMAPEAELFLVRVSSFTSFENAARWAIAEDIDVLSMSVSYYGDSFVDGTGPFAPWMEALEAAGVLLVTSAGNNARQHWSGPFRDEDADGRMDFGGGNGLGFEVPVGRDRRVNLIWNQYRSCGATDLDLVVLNADGDVVGQGDAPQQIGADGCQPVERANYDVPEPGAYRIEVWHRAGAIAGLEIDVLTRQGALYQPDPRASITVPAEHPFAFAVGAVRADQYLTAPVEGFSSWGPSQAGVSKPDVVGPDRLSTEISGAAGFSGTSASTPAVAGMIAVVMSADPSLDARGAAEHVRRHALGQHAFGASPDPAFGAGRARLPQPGPNEGGCGRRPLVMPLFLLPLGLLRVRWRR